MVALQLLLKTATKLDFLYCLGTAMQHHTAIVATITIDQRDLSWIFVPA